MAWMPLKGNLFDPGLTVHAGIGVAPQNKCRYAADLMPIL